MMKILKIGTLILLFTLLLICLGAAIVNAATAPPQTVSPTTMSTVAPSPVRTITPMRTVAPTPIRTITPVRTVTPTPIRTATPRRTATPGRTPTPTPEDPDQIPIVIKYYLHNVHEHNNTGQVANDFEVHLAGAVSVLGVGGVNNPFATVAVAYDPVTNSTALRFSGGEVLPCQAVWICIITAAPVTENGPRTWTHDGQPIGQGGPGVNADIQGYYPPGQVDLVIRNNNKEAITVTGLQYGFGSKVYSLAELIWDIPGMSWSNPKPDIRLNPGQSFTISSISLPASAVGLVYRYKAYSDSNPGNIVENVGQIVPQKNYEVFYLIRNANGSTASVFVTIKNNSASDINGWTLAWLFPGNQKITKMANGIYTQDGASVTVQNTIYNATIPANGGSVNFQFAISYSGENNVPNTITLNGISCLVLPEPIITVPTPTPSPAP